MCAHCAHIAKTNGMSDKKPNRTKEPTNIGIEPDLKQPASRYFAATRHGNLTGFVNAALRREYARGQEKLKKLGLPVPESAKR